MRTTKATRELVIRVRELCAGCDTKQEARERIGSAGLSWLMGVIEDMRDFCALRGQ